jgi:hypothetical protein
MWNEDNPDYPRILRRVNPNVNVYSRDPYFFAAFEKGTDKIVGYTGWTAHSGFVVLAGTRVTKRPGFRETYIASRLIDKRQGKLSNSNVIVGFNNNTLPEGAWVGAFERRGYKMNPENSEIQGIPQDVVDYFRERFGDMWGVYMPNTMTKSWAILKPFTEKEAQVYIKGII